VRLRPAELSDLDLLLEWRNDPVTRENSRSTAVVSAEDHLLWLRRTLDANDRHLYVAELDDGTPCGTVRVDRDQAAAEISLTVAPAQRGRGLAAEIITLATREACRRGVRLLRAEIKPENEPSIRAFRRAGYAAAAQDGELLAMTFHPGDHVS
jgi:RimJ/RimL family protein N-acetyltransferase